MKKNILLISTVNLEDNGIATFVMQSAKILTKLGNEVTIIPKNRVDLSRKKELIQQGVKIHDDVPRKKIIRYFFELVKNIKKNRYDIVHVHGNSNTMAVELLAAKIAGCKVRISHSHNTKTNHEYINKSLYLLFKNIVTYRLACSQEAGKWLYGKENFEVINNGIWLEDYLFNLEKRREIRKQLKIKDTTKLLGHVGRFNAQKNQEFLVNLIKELDEEYKLILIGSGQLQRNIKEKVKKLGLTNRIIFTGTVDNVNEYMYAMDEFLLPSRYEGLPFTLIEAQATGINCLVSNNVVPDVNLTNNVKFLDINSINPWKDNIIKIVDNIERANKSKKAIETLSEAGYSVEQNIIDMNRVYEKFL